MAEFTARHASTQAEVRDGNGVVLELIREVIVALGHGTNEHADTLLWIESLDIVLDTDNGTFERERDFAAVWRKVIGDGVFDDAEEFLLGSRGADG